MFELKTGGKPESFEFSVDGEKYSVPLLRSLDIETANEFRDLETDRAVTDWIMENIFRANAPKALEAITIGQYAELQQAYIDASKVSVGE